MMNEASRARPSILVPSATPTLPRGTPNTVTMLENSSYALKLPTSASPNRKRIRLADQFVAVIVMTLPYPGHIDR